jgi:hypothetical protein
MSGEGLGGDRSDLDLYEREVECYSDKRGYDVGGASKS